MATLADEIRPVGGIEWHDWGGLIFQNEWVLVFPIVKKMDKLSRLGEIRRGIYWSGVIGVTETL